VIDDREGTPLLPMRKIWGSAEILGGMRALRLDGLELDSHENDEA
jgi:hypothetical protein